MIISKRERKIENSSKYFMGTYCNIFFDPKVGINENGEQYEYIEAFIDGEVDEDMYYAFVEVIQEIKKRENAELRYTSEVRITFSSIGGSVTCGFSIIDMIDLHNSTSPVKISFVATGGNFSMAIPILCSGFNRYCFEYSKFMIHQVSGGAFGKVNDMEKRVTFSRELNEDIVSYIKSKTLLGDDKISEIFKEEHYFNAEKALEYGIVHNIIYFKNDDNFEEEKIKKNKSNKILDKKKKV